MTYEVDSDQKSVDIMTPSSYTFLEVVAQKQHYEKPTLRNLGCTPLGSSDVPDRSGDGSTSRRPLEPTA
jgi:hypothetical protein